MTPLAVCNVTILAIALIYYTWRDARANRARRAADLNERVAKMLWAAAQKTA